MRKRITIVYFMLFLLLFGSNILSVKACPADDPDCNTIEGEAQNKSADSDAPNVNDGASYPYNTWFDTKTTVTMKVGEYETSVGLCAASVKNHEWSPGGKYSCSGEYLPDMPSALNEDGTTNKEYIEYMNNLYEDAVKDGKLNEDSIIGRQIIDTIVNSGEVDCGSKGDAECANDYILSQSEEGDDGIGIVSTLCLITNQGCFEGDVAKNLTGIKGSNAAENMCKAAIAGTAQKEFSSKVGEGCKATYDMLGKLCTTDIYDDDDDDIPNPPTDNPNPPSTCRTPPCKPSTFEPKELLPEIEYELPTGSTPSMVCGQSYYANIWQWGEYVNGQECIEKYIYMHNVSVDAVQNDVEVQAGQSFEWGYTHGNVTTKKTITDGAKLHVKAYNAEVTLYNIEKAKEYADDLDKYWQDLIADQKEEMDDLNDDWIDCESDIEKKDCSSEWREYFYASNKYSESNQSYAKDKKEIIEPYRKNYNENYDKANSAYEKYNKCWETFQTYGTSKTTISYSDAIYTSDEKMTLLGTTQTKGSVIAVNKGNGQMILEGSINADGTTNNRNSIPNNSVYVRNPVDAFFVPSYVGDGKYQGALTETVEIMASNLNLSFPISCNLIVNNNIFRCENDQCNNLNIIYRPISLNNPFPGDNGQYRYRLGKWSYDSVVEHVITNNRGVNTNEVYNLTPMYTITLTPATIREIREYNRRNEYGDFNLRCTNGLYCQSNFLWGYDNELVNFSEIIDMSNSCAMSSDWYNCYKAGESYAEGYYYYLK